MREPIEVTAIDTQRGIMRTATPSGLALSGSAICLLPGQLPRRRHRNLRLTVVDFQGDVAVTAVVANHTEGLGVEDFGRSQRRQQEQRHEARQGEHLVKIPRIRVLVTFACSRALFFSVIFPLHRPNNGLIVSTLR